jgi:hypothetical protein
MARSSSSTAARMGAGAGTSGRMMRSAARKQAVISSIEG